MRRPLLLACLLAGCQPMYGSPSEPLHTPASHHPPKGTTTEAAVAYVEDCPVDFRRDARTVRRQPQVAETLVTEGDTSVESSAKATSDTAKVDLIVRGIQHYADALRADPYDAHATLKLALAYDRVLHKGCALAMLHRLDALAQNPKLAQDAQHRIDDIVDNTQWFKGYRKDALSAVNR